MEFNQKKVGIIMAATIVIGASALGGLFYSSHKADAKEAVAKQVVMDNIGKQQDLQEAAKQAKADAPVVTEDYPARIVPSTTQDTSKSTLSATTSATNQATLQPATTASKEIPQQSPPQLQIAPTVIPSAPIKQDPVPAITTLSDTDIQRLQAYKQYKTIGGKPSPCFVDFAEMYATQRDNCDWPFSPITLSDYFKMKAEWLTSQKLVYRNSNGDFCIRGVLTLTAYEENKLGLTPNVKYQCDAEYSLCNSVRNGKITLSLADQQYLSPFKAVK